MLLDLHFLPVVESIERDFQRWNKLPLSLRGRVSSVKMMALASILYICINLPVAPDKRLCKRLSVATHKFIWTGRPARIPRSILQLSRYDGGMSLANFYNYWMAAQLEWLRRFSREYPRQGNVGTRDLLYAHPSGHRGDSYLAKHVVKLLWDIEPGFPQQISTWCPVTMLPALQEKWQEWLVHN